MPVKSFRDNILKYAADTYGTEPEYLWQRTPSFAVLRRRDSGKWYGLIMDLPRRTFGLDGGGDADVLNIKCDPLLASSLPDGRGYFPAYHMSKTHWVSILLDGTVPLGEIFSLVDVSFDAAGKKSSPKKRP